MRLFLVVALGVLAVGGITAAVITPGDDNRSGYVAEHPVAVPEIKRTVFVSAAMPTPSPSENRLTAKLEDGTMPAAAIPAEILSDTECTPDHKMVSHCRNEVRLRNGKHLVLRHPHDMRKVSCLAPGEWVKLVPRAA